jgi:hypothetical protein
MLDFPPSPQVDDEYLLWRWDGVKWFRPPPAPPVSGAEVGPTAPPTPDTGQFWFNTTAQQLMIWDGSSWAITLGEIDGGEYS